MTTLVELLEKVQVINREHAALEHEERRAFNIFTILRAEDDEVNLHSRFLFELLNPQGAHGMGTAFLECFLVQAGLDNFDVATATVQREYRNMDMLIANGRQQAIVVENKIYAPDQPKQLLRYYKTARKEGYRDVRVLYLTLYGDAPGEESAGNLDEEIITVSYADDVRLWLEACIVAVNKYPVIRETLVQYRCLVEGLTGQAEGRELMDVKALLKDEESLTAAMSISQALIEVKIDVQFSFWVALEEKLLAAGFDIMDYWKYSRKKVEAYYKKGRRGYGLMMSLPDLLGQEVLAFYVGVSRNRVYYGFVVLEDQSPVAKAGDPGYVCLVEILKNLEKDWNLGSYMIGWKVSRNPIAFRSFDTPATFDLLDQKKRDVYLDEFVDEITLAIEPFYAACEQDPRLVEQSDW